jgi:purine-nucleoside phosphorylase
MKTDWNIAAKSLDNALGVIKAVCAETPKAAIILGSGVNVLIDVDEPQVLPYEEVFGLAPTVAGHAGSLTLGRVGVARTLVAIFRGRFHLYEGHDWSVVTLPTRVILSWGVKQLLLTNAAGGLNKNFDVGDLMVLTGFRDMQNPKLVESGLLPALMQPVTNCENALTAQIIRTGGRLNREDPGEFRPLQKGTYSACLGPSYETLAEIEMLRRLKSDAVGMSTVPELLSAAGSGTAAAAVSVITNVWADDKPMGGHAEVLEASQAASRRLDKLFKAILAEL